MSLLACLLSATTTPAEAAEDDFQIWNPVQIVHPIGDDWVVALQSEYRLEDDASRISQVVYKPGVHYQIDETWMVSAGYKWIDKPSRANEQEPWQELTYNQSYGDLVTGHQLRLEERMIDGIDGILPRLRVLSHAAHPLGESPNYLTGFAAVRFNLDEKGTGPVSGFEQSRVYAGLGRHFGDHVQGEVGYLWRYERERTSADRSDHVLHFLLVVHTRPKASRKPTARDRFR